MRAQHQPTASRRFSFLGALRNERGSNVAQAAAVALFAAVLIGAILLVATNLGPSVTQSMQCLAAALGGGGGGCGPGGDAPAQAEAPQPEQQDEDDGGGFWGGVLDVVQVGLDVVGLVPGVGEIADGANGLISLARGDYTGAALSFGAMIPFAGWGATGAKWVRTGIEYSDEIADVARYGDEALQYGDEAATAGRNTDNLPSCPVGAAPTGKAPGLARPIAGPCLPDPSSLSNPAASRAANRTRNAINDHLTPSDLEGAWRDLHGNPVPRPGGGYYDHLGEVTDALDGLKQRAEEFRRMLDDPNISAADKAAIQRYLSSISRTIDYVEKVINRNEWIPGTQIPVEFIP